MSKPFCERHQRTFKLACCRLTKLRSGSSLVKCIVEAREFNNACRETKVLVDAYKSALCEALNNGSLKERKYQHLISKIELIVSQEPQYPAASKEAAGTVAKGESLLEVEREIELLEGSSQLFASIVLDFAMGLQRHLHDEALEAIHRFASRAGRTGRWLLVHAVHYALDVAETSVASQFVEVVLKHTGRAYWSRCSNREHCFFKPRRDRSTGRVIPVDSKRRAELLSIGLPPCRFSYEQALRDKDVDHIRATISGDNNVYLAGGIQGNKVPEWTRQFPDVANAIQKAIDQQEHWEQVDGDMVYESDSELLPDLIYIASAQDYESE